ncbi:MAG: hypothetical protein H6740_25655 [Alphaproteobacteria bacterium]|nr:hypothetical protein [Alphaproteobacteria bacterium]
MLLALLLTPPALADCAQPCETYHLAGTLPADGQEGVPTNAGVKVFLEGDCERGLTDGEVSVSVEVQGEDGPQSVPGELLEPGPEDIDPVYVFRPSSALLEGATHVATLSVLGEPVQVSFEVGSGALQGLGEVGPAVEARSVQAWYYTADHTVELTIEAEVTPLADPDGLSHLELVDVEAPGRVLDVKIVEGEGPVTMGVVLIEPTATYDLPRELCLAARQVDGRGVPAAFGDPPPLSEPSCVKVERLNRDCDGCGVGGRPAGVGLFMGVSWVVGRRRR